MTKYNYKNCQSLFGYSAEVHIRCGGKCQLCGCGGDPIDFDLWRQMTVEHLIGKSQSGYLKQIYEAVRDKLPDYPELEIDTICKAIDSFNTVSACQFCNSTTSREISPVSMGDLISSSEPSPDSILKNVRAACHGILANKRSKVEWKLKSVKEAFHKYVEPNIVGSS